MHLTKKRPPAFAGGLFRKCAKLLLARDELEQVHAAIAVAPLVVVPAHELEEAAVQSDATAGVEDRAVRIVDKVTTDHFVGGITEDPLEIGLTRLLHRGADLLVA